MAHFALNGAYAASNFTLASLTAILTGRYGSANTGVTGWDKGLTSDVSTLPEVLGQYGYRTGGFTTDAPSGFRPDYGLDRWISAFGNHARTTKLTRWKTSRQCSRTRQARLTPLAWLEKATERCACVFDDEATRTAHFPFVVHAPKEGEDPTGMLQLLWDAGQDEAAARPEQAMPGMAGGTAQEGIVEIQREDPLQNPCEQLGARQRQPL